MKNKISNKILLSENNIKFDKEHGSYIECKSTCGTKLIHKFICGKVREINI